MQPCRNMPLLNRNSHSQSIEAGFEVQAVGFRADPVKERKATVPTELCNTNNDEQCRTPGEVTHLQLLCHLLRVLSGNKTQP